MRTTVRSIAPPAAAACGADPLAIAEGIGERLVRSAVWYRGRCNWVALDAHAAGSVQRALGPDLGDGTAGISLFLAQLATSRAVAGAGDGDGALRRTALGAITQALGHAGRAPARGLYGGRVGIAYAAARCGELLGDELAAAARRDRAGWSWPPPGASRLHGLCGMSHGASGVAWALLELHAATGEARHRAAAERALDYERHWFDEQEGNWPDLRGIERREPRGAFRASFATSWSHGAPGIALTRLCAWQVLGDERHHDEAAIALAATAASVERDLLVPGADFSLGHGLAGNADVLLLGAGLRPEGAVLARRAGEIAASRHAGSLDGWPCGVPGSGLAPGLLPGHAGIGLFYLRLHDRAVPSPLLVGAPLS